MPFWPFLVLASAGLTLWGWRHNAWLLPALALCGYAAMRLIVAYCPTDYIEVAGCASWLFFAALMVYKGGEVPGFFYALSALTYPVLLVFGFRLDYMALSPVIADTFAAFALLSIGGGIHGMVNSLGDNRGSVAWLKSHSMGVASRQKKDDRRIQGDSEVIQNRLDAKCP